MESRFNAPAWAFAVVLAAYVPRFTSSFPWWPSEGVFLFVALVLTIIGLVQGRAFGSVLMLLVLFIAGPFQMFVVPFMHAAAFGRDQSHAALSAQLAAEDGPTPAPQAKGANDTVRSQRAAVQKYPGLAIRDSPMNLAFLARYNLWKQRNDPRLQRPDWPELLADDCAANP